MYKIRFFTSGVRKYILKIKRGLILLTMVNISNKYSSHSECHFSCNKCHYNRNDQLGNFPTSHHSMQVYTSIYVYVYYITTHDKGKPT